MNCVPHPVHFGWLNREEWDGRDIKFYGGDETRIDGFGGESWLKENNWENHDKMGE